MPNKKLPNGKIVSFQEYNGELDFSIALQIPITAPGAIAELEKRRNFVTSKLGINIGQSSKNFHITIQLFSPKLTQIQSVYEIYHEIKDSTKDITVTLANKNEIFGVENGARFPVAMVESKGLEKLQNLFNQKLQNCNVKCDNKFEFNPHVSLVDLGVSNVGVNVFDGLSNAAVTFTSGFELSHKNDAGEYVSLTLADLKWLGLKDTKEDLLKGLKDTLKETTFTRADILQFFEELKNRDGAHKHVHTQTNPKFDNFRMFFKSNPNPGEKGLWRTATFKESVKLLQEAYQKRKDEAEVNQQTQENALLSYKL